MSAAARRIRVLRQLPLFRELGDEDLERVAAIAFEATYAPGSVVCRRGDEGRELYVVTGGKAQVMRGSRLIAKVGAGEVLGELAMLDSYPRSADIVAAEDDGGELQLLRVHGDELLALVDASPTLARALLRVLAARVRETGSRQERVDQLVRAYRERGHVLADLDPLGVRARGDHPELALEHYGLDASDLEAACTYSIAGRAIRQPLKLVLERLRETYCAAVGVQYMHIDDLGIQEWIREELEDPDRRTPLSREDQLRILAKLTDAELFETFLQQTFARAQRFSLEGAETLIPLLDQAVEKGGLLGVEEVVIGMAHRGRLNVLANILGKPASRIFREFDETDEDTGDVKYHKGFTGSRETACGRIVQLHLCFNPSHLEFVGPVVAGRARARQDGREDGDRSRVLPVVIHGDGAFAGQGIVQELFNLGELPGYTTGGTLHVVLNNQIGFTTPPEQARSTLYATDVARMLQIPIFHVNGERPEAVDFVVDLALRFRRRFRRDVVIDMYAYRRHGHNERDEPAFTQPLLYEAIARRGSVRAAYTENLVGLGDVTAEEAEAIATRCRTGLDQELARARTVEGSVEAPAPGCGAPPRAALPRPRPAELLAALAACPPGLQLHPKVARTLEARAAMARGERRVDWGAAEALALASLLSEGVSVRLSGQDSERGTFGHRHAVLHDQGTGRRHVPLEALAARGARATVVNSPLSEASVLGFEFGYSLDAPSALVVWEAQFGDFCNVAQVVVDQFICCSLEKWRQPSRLVMLLPHGFEGQGPEHSSARPERFLQLCAGDNLTVASPTTAAQLFHLLRGQALGERDAPLVLLTPKRWLQHPATASPLEELESGAFRPLLDDEAAGVEPARRVVLCCGQLAHALLAARAERRTAGVRIVRLEQLHPLPLPALARILEEHPAAELCWAQEEPENMGAWSSLAPRLAELVPSGRLAHVARRASASPATGSLRTHEREQRELVERALA